MFLFQILKEEFALLKFDLSKSAISFYILWILHLIFNIVGWKAVWSTTYYEIVSNPNTHDYDGLSDPLYSATFWDNVREFYQNNAQGTYKNTSILMLISFIYIRTYFIMISYY